MVEALENDEPVHEGPARFPTESNPVPQAENQLPRGEGARVDGAYDVGGAVFGLWL